MGCKGKCLQPAFLPVNIIVILIIMKSFIKKKMARKFC
jgi:hypothetical protein